MLLVFVRVCTVVAEALPRNAGFPAKKIEVAPGLWAGQHLEGLRQQLEPCLLIMFVYACVYVCMYVCM